MVSLSIPEEAFAGGLNATPNELSLRETALWYPDVPPTNLELNEKDFPSRAASLSDFLPAFYVRFDGSDRKVRDNLVKVTATFNGSRLDNIDFYFEAEGGAVRHEQLGRGYQPFAVSTHSFDIDGARGERIEWIDLSLRPHGGPSTPLYLQNGELRGFQVGRLLPYTSRAPSTGSLRMEDDSRSLADPDQSWKEHALSAGPVCSLRSRAHAVAR